RDRTTRPPGPGAGRGSHGQSRRRRQRSPAPEAARREAGRSSPVLPRLRDPGALHLLREVTGLDLLVAQRIEQRGSLLRCHLTGAVRDALLLALLGLLLLRLLCLLLARLRVLLITLLLLGLLLVFLLRLLL